MPRRKTVSIAADLHVGSAAYAHSLNCMYVTWTPSEVCLGSLASMCQVPAANHQFGLWTCQALLDNRSGFPILCRAHRGPRGR